MTARRRLLALAVLVTAVTAGRPLAQAPAPAPAATPQQLFLDDVHAKAGLGCESCHTSGGPAGGPIERTKIAPLCATCHASAEYMKKFNPQVRVDQYQQYLASTHGKKMARARRGSRPAPTATARTGFVPWRTRGRRSRRRTWPRPVRSATRITPACRPSATRAIRRKTGKRACMPPRCSSAATCRRRPAAPATASHGAVPPGVTSVAFICAQCHVREAELFRKSAKKPIFDLIGQGECLTCHGNHRIQKPSDSFIGLKDPALCATCHNDQMNGAAVITAMQQGLQDLGVGIDRAQRGARPRGPRRDARR